MSLHQGQAFRCLQLKILRVEQATVTRNHGNASGLFGKHKGPSVPTQRKKWKRNVQGKAGHGNIER